MVVDMETNKKIDLNTMNEQDWEKYNKMRKVASRKEVVANIISIFFIVGIFLFIVGIFLGFINSSFPLIKHQSSLANYSTNQTNYLLHNLNISSINNTANWNNSTLTTLILSMKNNPKLLSTFAVNTYTTTQNEFYIILMIIILLIFLAICLKIIDIIGSGENFFLTKRYKFFKKQLKILAEKDANLKAYGFTEQEIVWYHTIRGEMIKLEIEYKL